MKKVSKVDRAYQTHDPHLRLSICSWVASVQPQKTWSASVVQAQKAWGRQILEAQKKFSQAPNKPRKKKT